MKALVSLGRSGRYAVIDLRDFPAVARRRWFLLIDRDARRTAYAYTEVRDASGRRRKIRLHAFLWALWRRRPAPRIDHANGDGLDCTRTNLRRATVAQNAANHPRRHDNTSGCRGVDFDRRRGAWRVRIQSRGRRVLIGHFPRLTEAVRCYRACARVVHGRFARVEVA